ncbi:MAG: serine acetyltransferase [Gammaproteobacteria bacterium]|nr:serine acetyltransferase [Gammaproteobacteria bacterium]
MKFKDFTQLVYADLYRYEGKTSLRALLQELLTGEGYAYCFWMRFCCFTYGQSLLKYSVHIFGRWMLRHYRYKLGISIPFTTKVGPGFYIGHFGTLIVSANCCIGRNCNISQGVTIGISNRGIRRGCPRIGDNVYIGPGAKIIGSITVGNNVAIGANAVVTKDVPDHTVVAGVPARELSQKGSAGYINYACKLRQ